MWDPPVIDEQTMTRRSVLSEASELLADLVLNGARTICFLKSRRGIELIQNFTRARLEELGEPSLAARIAPYRAGYTPYQRREIEAELAAGELLAVVATDALELGIDIGELDAAICVTFPGTVASLRQMWGRAGRRSEGIARLPRRRGRARPVLLPPPRRVPRAPGRGRDPRPRERADPDAAPARRRLRGAARRTSRGATTRSSASAGACAPTASSPPASCGAAATAATCRAGPDSRRARSRCARPRPTRSRSSTRLGRAARRGRGGARVHDGPPRRGLPAPRALLRGPRARRRGRRAIVEPFDGDWYTQPKKETEVFIERDRASQRERAGGVELSLRRRSPSPSR